MNKNIEYTNRYVDSLSEDEAKEILKKILNEKYSTEKTGELDKVYKQVSALYINENRKDIDLQIPKLK